MSCHSQANQLSKSSQPIVKGFFSGTLVDVMILLFISTNGHFDLKLRISYTRGGQINVNPKQFETNFGSFLIYGPKLIFFI